MARQRLDEVGIPIPNYALVNRDFPDQEVDHFVEEEDYVEINGKRIFKPFVEKPVDGMHVLSAALWESSVFIFSESFSDFSLATSPFSDRIFSSLNMFVLSP